MGQDWFRKTSWDEADRADFRARLARAQKYGRPQYLRIQAGTLMECGDQFLPAALELLDELLRDFPDSLELAGALEQKGELLYALGNVEAAAEAYAASVARMRSVPKMQTQDGWLNYGLLVAIEKLVLRYDDALQVLEEFSGTSPLMLSADWFKVRGSRALIFSERGLVREAAVNARLALEAAVQASSGIPYRPSLGLVGDRFSELREELREIAAA